MAADAAARPRPSPLLRLGADLNQGSSSVARGGLTERVSLCPQQPAADSTVQPSTCTAAQTASPGARSDGTALAAAKVGLLPSPPAREGKGGSKAPTKC